MLALPLVPDIARRRHDEPVPVDPPTTAYHHRATSATIVIDGSAACHSSLASARKNGSKGPDLVPRPALLCILRRVSYIM